ncbi:hypothetical protein V496_06002 [Pseudogymnoascus sp. VKM F-4515 (FW-2607)]|nr:hypothetical protein V496_06002 [Pseudogymnoascus sp. VKM F-4515 (FW-2607)]
MESYFDTLLAPAPLVTGGVLILVALLSMILRPTESFNVPFVGVEDRDMSKMKAKYVHEADKLLREGYDKFQASIFQVMTPDGPRLFLPRSFANELKGYPRHEMSGMKATTDRLLGEYTTIDHESQTGLNSIKIDLNRHLDWTSINLNDKLPRIVAQASALIFVGPALNRNKDWLNCTTTFAADVMIGGEKLKTWKPILRPVAQYFIPEVRRIQSDHAFAHTLLLPVLKSRAEEESRQGEKYAKPNDMIQWIQDRARKSGDKTVDTKEQANLQMLAATAAIHTTRMAVMHAIYDLAARPEYVEPLREEIQNALKMSGGTFTKQCLTQLRRLDSFMKESQRHNPPSIATFQRKALVPVKLSNGFHIPSGTIVQCNTNILEESPPSWGDPLSFDGFRFYKLRSKPEDTNKYQFASPSFDSMQFGLGNDACPGRFFASNQIKIILVYIFRHYDIKFEEGEVGRPKNILFEIAIFTAKTHINGAQEPRLPKVIEDIDVILKVTGSTVCGYNLHLLHSSIVELQKGDILGHEFCGIVDELGSALKNLKKGDRVVARFQIKAMYGVPLGDGNLLKLPDDVPDEKGLFLSDEGDAVAIWGAGPVGQMWAEFSFMNGASRVIMIDHNWRLDFVKEKYPKVESANYSELKGI